MGAEGERLSELVQRTNEAFNEPVRLQTQQVCVALSARSEVEPGVIVRQTDPLPMTVLALQIQVV